MTEHKDENVKVFIAKNPDGKLFTVPHASSNVIHTVTVTIPWYIFPNDKLDIKKALQVRKYSNTDDWVDVDTCEVSAEGIFHYEAGDMQDSLTPYEIANFCRNSPEPQVIYLNGKKYKLVEVDDSTT